MIYVDTSVVLAYLLAEDRYPPDDFWRQELVTSRLLEYEVWTRLNAKKLKSSHGEAARAIISRLAFVELVAPALTRALEPFPAPVRTLDGLHLATAYFLKTRDPSLTVATYDKTLAAAAQALGFAVIEP